jgi:hypothetical protein
MGDAPRHWHAFVLASAMPRSNRERCHMARGCLAAL